MGLEQSEKLDIDDGNNHVWFKVSRFTDKELTICGNCGYLRRLDENNKPLNKPCVGKVAISLRQH